MSKFAAMGINVSEGVRMPIIYPGDDVPVKDASEKIGYLALLSFDSDVGRKLTKQAGVDVRRKVMQGGVIADEVDAERRNIEAVATLTTGWHLVAPDGSVIDVPFSREAAIEFYSDPAMAWLLRRALTFVSVDANFMKRSS